VRGVANDYHVDVDTVRYSVPFWLVKQRVEVQQTEEHVVVLSGGREVARHRRSYQRHSMVSDPAHAPAGRRSASDEGTTQPPSSPLAAYGRSLADYAALIGAAP
jgi:hypothetical protein